MDEHRTRLLKENQQLKERVKLLEEEKKDIEKFSVDQAKTFEEIVESRDKIIQKLSHELEERENEMKVCKESIDAMAKEILTRDKYNSEELRKLYVENLANKIRRRMLEKKISDSNQQSEPPAKRARYNEDCDLLLSPTMKNNIEKLVEEVNKVSSDVPDLRRHEICLVLDTNFIFNFYVFTNDFLTEPFKFESLNPIVFIPLTVLKELDGLKLNPQKSFKARSAANMLRKLQKRKCPKLRFERLEEVRSYHEDWGTTPDLTIIESCIFLRLEYPVSNIILISSDIMISITADAFGIRVMEPDEFQSKIGL